MDYEKKQREHYNVLGHGYEAHYDDRWSKLYRKIFLVHPLLKGLNLKDKKILEAMCGSGQNTGFLQNAGAKVVGLDISDTMVGYFRRKWPSTDVICRSILDTGFENESFDGVLLMGGLHHLHPQVGAAINEIRRILKPGGFFCFFEPHTGSFFDRARAWWYKRDRSMFEENESSIDIHRLKDNFKNEFDFDFEKFGGGIAYMLVYNSLVFRVPLWLKKFYSLPLILLEWLLAPLFGEATTFYVLSRWYKK